jgi:signal transduction histidine kinase
LGLRVQFLLAASLMFVASMLVLGTWIQGRIETDWRQSAIAATGRFLDDVLGDHVGELLSNPDPGSGEAARRLTAEIGGSLGKEFAAITVWNTQGNQVFSTRRHAMEQVLPEEVRTGVLAGETMVRPRGAAFHAEHSAVMRVYAPIFNPLTGAIVAIGGADQRSGEIDRLARAESMKTWPIVGAATVVMVAFLYLLVTNAAATIEQQQAALVRQAQRARRLGRRSAVLARLAEQARHDAMVAIEKTLARVGSDIHDGPIQRLAILALRLGESDAGRGLGADMQQVVAELRDITGGLALPELEGEDLEGAVKLAVAGHEKITGGKVALRLDPLPPQVRKSLKVSAFRIVQEALSNGFRHGGGADQAVHAQTCEGYLVLTISDAGSGFPDPPPQGDGASPCLASLASRVEAMRGDIFVARVEPHGARVQVLLPLGLRPARAAEAL